MPRQLLEAVDEVLKTKGSDPPDSTRSDVAPRLGVALACWLHGSLTTEQAIGVLRTSRPSRR
jgi:hypothetical protein